VTRLAKDEMKIFSTNSEGKHTPHMIECLHMLTASAGILELPVNQDNVEEVTTFMERAFQVGGGWGVGAGEWGGGSGEAGVGRREWGVGRREWGGECPETQRNKQLLPIS
jgi:hypothetical protein